MKLQRYKPASAHIDCLPSDDGDYYLASDVDSLPTDQPREVGSPTGTHECDSSKRYGMCACGSSRGQAMEIDWEKVRRGYLEAIGSSSPKDDLSDAEWELLDRLAREHSKEIVANGWIWKEAEDCNCYGPFIPDGPAPCDFALDHPEPITGDAPPAWTNGDGSWVRVAVVEGK